MAYSAALHKAWFLACIASACSSSALLGTTSAAIKAWSLACIASAAAQTNCWAPSRQLSKPGSWHVSPAPACRTHCLAPPHQLSQPGSGHASPAAAAVQLIRTPWYHLISYLHVSHRLNYGETVVRLVACFQIKLQFQIAHVCNLITYCISNCTFVQFELSRNFAMPLPKTPPTAEQWANIVGMLASAHAGSPAVHSACTWGQTEAQRDMSLRALYTELRNVKNMRRLESALRRPHPAALHADGFSAETRPRGRRIPTQILCHTKSLGRSIRRYRTLPAAPGGSRRRGRYLRVPGAG